MSGLPIDYIVISTVALGVAALTFFSGFGLGSLLMPFFAVFFEVDVAVAATAIVHLLNNLLKGGLMYKHADWGVVLRFALPAALSAVAGALLLNMVSGLEPVYSYRLFGSFFEITWVKLTVALLVAVFAVVEIHPRFEKLAFPQKYMPLGGAVSGFFGGLSGHQGAMRSAFLIKAGLDKESFVGTSVVSAVVVDLTRLLVYGFTFFRADFVKIGQGESGGLILAGTAAAFAGTLIGRRLLEKITMKTVQYTVAVMLFVLALVLGFGLV